MVGKLERHAKTEKPECVWNERCIEEREPEREDAHTPAHGGEHPGAELHHAERVQSILLSPGGRAGVDAPDDARSKSDSAFIPLNDEPQFLATASNVRESGSNHAAFNHAVGCEFRGDFVASRHSGLTLRRRRHDFTLRARCSANPHAS